MLSYLQTRNAIVFWLLGMLCSPFKVFKYLLFFQMFLQIYDTQRLVMQPFLRMVNRPVKRPSLYLFQTSAK